MFQSTPDQLVGRLAKPKTPWKQQKKFQSTPDQLVGRLVSFNAVTDLVCVSIHARPIGRAIPTGKITDHGVFNVSIHARPIGRAIRDQSADQPAPKSRFNPRPTNWSGDSIHPPRKYPCPKFQSTPDQLVGRFSSHAPFDEDVVVSIHARPIGRAIRPV